MCFGSRAPQAPVINYTSPPPQDTSAQEQSLEDYSKMQQDSMDTFMASINAQIASAEKQNADLLAQMAEQSQAMLASNEATRTSISEAQAAAAEYGQQGGGAGQPSMETVQAPYAITTEENVEATEAAQTTEEIKKKKKPVSTLKISRGGLSSSTGTGVNYGV